MLPEKRFNGPHNDDKFIQEELAKIGHAWRQGAANRYSQVYEESGRREAHIMREALVSYGMTQVSINEMLGRK